jgi:hypothetical protein
VYDHTGKLIEGKSRPVDVAVERPAGEWYGGTDGQLEAAVKTLLGDIDAKGPRNRMKQNVTKN